MQQIPLSQVPGQVFNLVLDGQYCTIALYWRQTRLYLDLNVSEQVICQGAICQNRASIIQSPSRHFKGSLHFLDIEGNRPPNWKSLHTGDSGRYMLLYAAEGETLPQKLEL